MRLGFDFIIRKQNILPTIFILLLLVLFVAWFAPAERTLGNLVKLIYIHAAISWIAPLVVLLVSRTGRVVHPLNPILASSGLKIKICSGIIALILLAIALQIARWLRESGRSILPH